MVEASSGAMGGSESNEFVAKTPAGEDLVATCESCGYAANLEKATSRLPVIDDGAQATEEFPTPGVRTIEDLITFPGGAPADRQIKTLVYLAEIMHMDMRAPRTASFVWEPVVALLRGDHQLHETKLLDALGGLAIRLRAAHPDEIRALLCASAGSLGGVGAKEKVEKSSYQTAMFFC